MIFLMYALTWSSSETIMFKPYFLTLREVLAQLWRLEPITLCAYAEKSSAGYTPRWNRIVLMEYSKNSVTYA